MGPNSGQGGPSSFPEFYFSQTFVPTYIIVSNGGNPFFDAASSETLTTSGGASFTDERAGCSPIALKSVGFYTARSASDLFSVIYSAGYGGAITMQPWGPVPSPKNLGSTDPTCSANTCEGDPVNTATGNLFEVETDFVGGPASHLELRRYYNSQAVNSTPFGSNWSSTYDRRILTAPGSALAQVYHPDGRIDSFWLTGGSWVGDPDVRSTLASTTSGGVQTGWQAVNADDSVENYNLGGQLTSIVTRTGLATSVTYNAAGQLATVIGPFGHTLTYTYDASNRVSTVTAPDGGVYTYSYDGNNNLASVTYPDATVRQYTYTDTSYVNALTGIVDELGNTYAAIAYDSQGRVGTTQLAGGADLTIFSYTSNVFGISATAVTDARGNFHTYGFTQQFGLMKPVSLTGAPVQSSGGQAFSYDTNGFMQTSTDWNGNVTYYTHDARGDETSRTEAYGTSLARTITTQWHPVWHLPTQITEPNRVTTFKYNSSGTLSTETVTAGTLSRRWQYAYYATTLLKSAAGPRFDVSQITRYTYDSTGDVASVTDALGHLTRITSYNPAGRPLRMVDPNGLVTLLTYDPRGRLTSVAAGSQTTTYRYDNAGNRIQVTLPDASYFLYSYDNAHRLTAVKDALGDVLQYTLDTAGNVTARSAYDPAGTLRRTRAYAYDAVNNLQQEIGAQGQTITYGRDPQGNLTSVKDANGNVATFGYDALNRLIGMSDPNQGISSYRYDANDHLTGVVEPRNLTTTYGWNGLDEQTSVLSPDSGYRQNTSFDAAGNVLSSVDARGATKTTTYDALNRPLTAAYSDGAAITYTYDTGSDGIGHLAQMTDPVGTTTWSYDVFGHVLGKIQQTATSPSVRLAASYAYNARGQLTALTYPSGKVVGLGYDSAGHITALSLGTSALVSGALYQPFDTGAAQWTQSDGAAYLRSYDLDGRIAGITIGSTGQAAATSLAYGFDANSNITGQTETGQFAETFGYDGLNRLTGIAVGTPSNYTLYGYDADGNRVSAAAPSGTTSYAYPASSNQLASLSGLLQQANVYDAAGNLQNDGEVAYTYDARGRMASATIGGLTTYFGVNGLGQRIAKVGAGVLGTVAYTYATSGHVLVSQQVAQPMPPVVAGQIEYEYDEAGGLLGEYDQNATALEETVYLGDLPVAVVQGSGSSAAVYAISPDNLGAPHIIAASSGVPVWSWDHMPFGETAPNQNPAGLGSFTYSPRFPGQVYDPEYGLSYNAARDYNAVLGRYVQSDPIGLRGERTPTHMSETTH